MNIKREIPGERYLDKRLQKSREKVLEAREKVLEARD